MPDINSQRILPNCPSGGWDAAISLKYAIEATQFSPNKPAPLQFVPASVNQLPLGCNKPGHDCCGFQSLKSGRIDDIWTVSEK
jgi:hypothetical protein